MFLPSYRYTPAVTEALAELDRLLARLAGRAPDPDAEAVAWRGARARRAAGAVRLDGWDVTPAGAAQWLAGAAEGGPPGAQHAVRGYAFALEQIAGDWPAGREVTALPVLAGLHFFVTPDPARRGLPPGLRRDPGALLDLQTGRPLATAPPPAAIRPALQDLVGWLHAARSAVAPAILAGVAYLRLTQIQPQYEANAATVCAYTALLLHRAGLLPHGLPAFEAAFTADPAGYYAAVLAAPFDVESAAPEVTAWLEYFLGVLRGELRAACVALEVPAGGPAGTPRVRLNPRQRRMLDLLAVPGASLANQECQQIFAVSPVTAARDFRELVELGLVEMQGQGRATYYVLRAT